MNQLGLKNIGLILLAVGVAVAAASGTRLSPEMLESNVVEARAAVATGAAAAVLSEYCGELAKAELPPEPACPQFGGHCAAIAEKLAAGESAEEDPRCPDLAEEGGEESAPAEEEATTAPPRTPPDFDTLVAQKRAEVATFRGQEPADLPAELRDLRAKWLRYAEASAEPAARAALVRPQEPMARVSSWFGQSGLMFLLGIALVIAGAVLGRIGARREAQAEGPSDADGGGPVDFGLLLGELQDEVQALADSIEEDEPPTPRRIEIKQMIESLQVEKLDRLVEARPRVQVRYGMGAFAQIFGPLSGGERRLNRAWSALVDDHWPEAHASIQVAATQFRDARAVLDRVAAQGK